MSCFVVNGSGRTFHVTLDRDDSQLQANRYNLIISKDAVDRQRHLEQFDLKPNRRRQVYCLLEPFVISIDNRFPSSFWESAKDASGADLVLIKDFQ